MAYNSNAPESIEVEILEVFPKEGAVLIQSETGNEGRFNVVAPANISYARPGKATVKFSGNDISYLRNASTGNSTKPAYQPYQKKPYYNQGNQNNYYKNYNQTPAQAPPQFATATNYTQANPVTQAKVEAVRKIVLFYESLTGQEFSEIYNKISSVAEIKASTLHLRADFVSEKIDKKEVNHMLYDAFIYASVPTGVSSNVLSKLLETIREKEPVVVEDAIVTEKVQ